MEDVPPLAFPFVQEDLACMFLDPLKYNQINLVN